MLARLGGELDRIDVLADPELGEQVVVLLGRVHDPHADPALRRG
jgi:hypothetical protein